MERRHFSAPNVTELKNYLAMLAATQFSSDLILPAALGPLIEITTRSRNMFLGSRERPVRKADSLAAICEQIV
jgi:hypothetical protein